MNKIWVLVIVIALSGCGICNQLKPLPPEPVLPDIPPWIDTINEPLILPDKLPVHPGKTDCEVPMGSMGGKEKE